MDYSLRFDPRKIGEFAERYPRKLNKDDRGCEGRIVSVIAPEAMKAGYYTKDQFLELCRWKTPRTQTRCAQNDEDFILQTTRIALATSNERLRIEVLTLLNGVSWPTASVLLHFGHRDRYPILDFHALWSLGIAEPKSDYTFAFWHDYVRICRRLADEHKVDMRTLDRALWQFSSENQPKSGG